MIQNKQLLSAEFMSRYYQLDRKKNMYILFEKNGRLPAYLYHAEDFTVYVLAHSGQLIPITYEISTFEELKKFYDLLFKMDIPF